MQAKVLISPKDASRIDTPYVPGADMSGTLSTMIHTHTHTLAIRNFADNLWPRTQCCNFITVFTERDLCARFVSCMLNATRRLLVVVQLVIVSQSINDALSACVCVCMFSLAPSCTISLRLNGQQQ